MLMCVFALPLWLSVCFVLLPSRAILAEPATRNLFGFLLLNLSFAFVELFYGMLTNRSVQRGMARLALCLSVCVCVDVL